MTEANNSFLGEQRNDMAFLRDIARHRPGSAACWATDPMTLNAREGGIRHAKWPGVSRFATVQRFARIGHKRFVGLQLRSSGRPEGVRGPDGRSSESVRDCSAN